MKVERLPPPYAPIVITVESIEEQRALLFLGCSSHVSLSHLDSFANGPPTGAKREVLKGVLTTFLELVK